MLVCLPLSFVFHFTIFDITVTNRCIVERFLSIAGKFYFSGVMCFIFLLIFNGGNDCIINRITDLQIVRIKEFRFLVKHPVTVSSQVIIACRERGRK